MTALRRVDDGLPTVDGMECLTYCEHPSVIYPWRIDRWMAARQCWECEWHTVGKRKGKRWISHWMPIAELTP